MNKLIRKVTKREQAKRLLIAGLFFLGIAGLYVVWVSLPSIIGVRGKVTSVHHVMNLVENGRYFFQVKDRFGRTYEVNATGRMNAPWSYPDNECVHMPLVEVGDSVEFRLPGSLSNFTTCYEEDTFRLLPYYFDTK